MKPLFSIIIPCFNQAHFLMDCFNSLIGQKNESWEAILINDGSTDETEMLGNKLAKLDSRFRFFSQSNQGLSAARNEGMREARGDFLIFLDADDWLESNCLTTYFSKIATNGNIELYSCSYAYWDKPTGRNYHTHFLNTGTNEIWPQVLTQNIGPCHSILIQRSLAMNLGGFDPSLKSCEDWDFWIRAGKIGTRMLSIQEVLVAYRYVPNSMSRNPLVMYESLSEVSRRASKVDPRIPTNSKYNQKFSIDDSEIQKKHIITVLGVMLHQGNVIEAQEWYKQELEKWNWSIENQDWKLLSSYLSWGYFFEREEIDSLIRDLKPRLISFFEGLSFEISIAKDLTRMILAPQLKKRNHQLLGRSIGGLKNKLGWY